MKPLCYLLPLLLQSFLFATGQTNSNDSLWTIVRENRRDPAEVKALNELASNYLRTDLSKARNILYQSIELAHGIDLPIPLSADYAQMAGICQMTGQVDSALYFLSLLKKLSGTNPAVKSNYLSAAGLFYKHQNNPRAALPFMLEALEMTTTAAKTDPSVTKRTSLAGQTLNVGNTYVEMNEYKKALGYHLEALRIFEEVGNQRGISFCYQMIGGGFQKLHQLKEAMNYTQKSLAMKTALNDERGIATSLQQIGSIHRYANRIDSSLFYYDKTLKIDQKMGLKTEEINMDLDIGNTYMDNHQPDKARPYFVNGKALARLLEDTSRMATFDAALITLQTTEKKQQITEKKLLSGVDNAIRTGDKTAELINYNYLAEHYAHTNQLEKSLEYTKKYYEMSDSLESRNIQLQLKKMEQQYNVEKKEKEIALLKKDQQLTHLNLEKQKAFQYGAALLFLLLLLIGFLVVNRWRIVQKARRTIEMEKMRNHIARDLHDDIGSTLTSINIMSNVALHSQEPQDAATRTTFEKIKQRSSAIMERMDDIIWTIHPRNDTMEQLLYRMEEFAGEILEPLNIHYTFQQQGDLSSIKLDVRQRKDLYLLFKEAVNNAAKYSQCNNLHIRLLKDRHSLQLEIIDDGKGFAEDGVKKGNGLNNMRERAASMPAKISIDSTLGQGTRIGLDLQIS